MKASGHYYRMSAAAVLEAFVSHTTGLSGNEAAKRKVHTEPFSSTVPTPLGRSVLLPALWVRFVLLFAAASVALYVGNITLGVLLYGLTIALGLAVGFYERKIPGGHIAARLRFPEKVRVVRDNAFHTIAFANIVPGDVIFVEAGDIVPADMRIIKADACIVSESTLDKERTHVAKHARTLTQNVPLRMRSNCLFFGSQVVRGTAYGVVTAAHAHTEIAQLLTQPIHQQQRPLSQRISQLQRRLDGATIILLALWAILAWVNAVPLYTAVTLGSLLIIASLLLDWYIIALCVAARRVHVLGNHGIRTLQLAALESIGSSRVIVADLASSFMSSSPALRSFHVGKTDYNVDRQPFSHDKAEPLGLFYTLVRLLQHTQQGKVFAPVIALLPSLDFGTFKHAARLPERFEGLSGGVWRAKTKNQTIIAATGGLPEIIDFCSDIWDHGHVRPLTGADKTRLLDTHRNNQNVVAIAYASSDDAQSLTFVGYGVLGNTRDPKAKTSLERLKKAHISPVFVSDMDAGTTTALLTEIGVPANQYTLIGGSDLQGVKPGPLAKVIAQTTLVLHDVSDKDLQLVMQACQQLGPTVCSSANIESAGLLAASDTVIAQTGTAASEQAAITVPAASLDVVEIVVHESRATTQQLAGNFYASLTALAAALLLAWFSFAGLFLFEYTPLVTPLGLCFALFIAAIPLRTSLGWHKQSNQLMRMQPASLLKPLQPALHATIIAITAAAAAIGSGLTFLLLNNISPQYLALTSQAFAKAMTLAIVTFSLCLIASTLISWFQNASTRRQSIFAHKSGLVAAGASILLLYGFVYTPFAQEALDTSSLGLQDWGIALAATAMFAIVTAAAHYDHRHTRKNIAVLHHTHKKSL